MAAITITGKGGDITYMNTTPSQAANKYEKETGKTAQTAKVGASNHKRELHEYQRRIKQAFKLMR